MVHVLKKTHNLMLKGGFLIEVHDEPVSPPLSLELGEEIIEVGLLQDSQRFLELRSANAAIEQVLSSHLFTRIDFVTMPYLIFIDTLESFEDWLSRVWDTSYLDSAVENYIRESLGPGGLASKVVVSRVAQVSILKSL